MFLTLPEFNIRLLVCKLQHSAISFGGENLPSYVVENLHQPLLPRPP